MPDPIISRSEILKALTQYYELGDLSFIDTVNNITYGYKKDMKYNLTKPNNDQQQS
jgi:hypothetical protein